MKNLIHILQRPAARMPAWNQCPQCKQEPTPRDMPRFQPLGFRPTVAPCANCTTLLTWDSAARRHLYTGVAIGLIPTTFAIIMLANPDLDASTNFYLLVLSLPLGAAAHLLIKAANKSMRLVPARPTTTPHPEPTE